MLRGVLRLKRILLLFCLTLLLTGMILASFRRINSVSAGAAAPFSPVVVLDAGHGGFYGGAQGQDGTVEKEINLAVTQKIDCLASLCGFETVMIRDADCSIEEEGVTGIRNRKVSDIHRRLDIAEEYPEALFLSIHQNHFPQEKQWGTQVFYGPKHPESRLLAERIQKNVIQILQPENRRAVKEAQQNLYILSRASNPAVMVECGFLSNRDECARLCRPDYQQQLAFVIVRSMLEQRIQNDEGTEKIDGVEA